MQTALGACLRYHLAKLGESDIAYTVFAGVLIEESLMDEMLYRFFADKLVVIFRVIWWLVDFHKVVFHNTFSFNGRSVRGGLLPLSGTSVLAFHLAFLFAALLLAWHPLFAFASVSVALAINPAWGNHKGCSGGDGGGFAAHGRHALRLVSPCKTQGILLATHQPITS